MIETGKAIERVVETSRKVIEDPLENYAYFRTHLEASLDALYCLNNGALPNSIVTGHEQTPNSPKVNRVEFAFINNGDNGLMLGSVNHDAGNLSLQSSLVAATYTLTEQGHKTTLVAFSGPKEHSVKKEITKALLSMVKAIENQSGKVRVIEKF